MIYAYMNFIVQSTLLTCRLLSELLLARNQISEFPSTSAQMVSAGGGHTVLLRNDGHAVAFGWNEYSRCNVPRLNQGITYTQVSAGRQHTVLLRSDGQTVAFGCRLLDGVAFHRWTKEFHTPKCLQEVVIQFF